MKKSTVFKMLRPIILLVTLVIMGCEPAPVETGTTTTNSGTTSTDGTTLGDDAGNDDGNDDGNDAGNDAGDDAGDDTGDDTGAYTTLAVAPASAVHTTVGTFTVLEITPVAGYTYRWTLSDSSLGNISPTQGNRATYFTTRIPTSGTAVQTITVTGTKSGSTVRYRGTSTITHRAN